MNILLVQPAPKPRDVKGNIETAEEVLACSTGAVR
jgi:predicted amidohydrolase